MMRSGSSGLKYSSNAFWYLLLGGSLLPTMGGGDLLINKRTN
jgi:hypothetical protein